MNNFVSNYGMPVRREDKILELLGRVNGKKILEVGCSTRKTFPALFAYQLAILAKKI